MTMRTHKMLADVGKGDSGKFLAVTHGGAGLGGVSPACKMFFPMTETTGTTITDPVPATDLVITPSTSIAFGEANAVTVAHTTGTTGAGTVPVVGTKATLLVACLKVDLSTGNTVVITAGASGSDSLTINQSGGAMLESGFIINNTFAYPDSVDLVQDQIAIVGCVIANSIAKVSVDGVWGDSVDLVTELADFQNNDNMKLGSISVTNHYYGVAMFQFDELPTDADMTEKLLEMKAAWTAGDKRIPIDWLTVKGS